MEDVIAALKRVVNRAFSSIKTVYLQRINYLIQFAQQRLMVCELRLIDYI